MTELKRKHPLAKCEECPLQNARCAPTSGPKDAKIAFVSRSPGHVDARLGKPFANARGSRPVLEYLFGQYKVRLEDVLKTNVVLCETDDPPKEAIAACKERLEAEIKDCELIIAGGTEATSALTRYRAVFSARPFIHRRGKAKVIVTNNPALVIRNSDAFPDMVEDFRRAFDPPPEPVFPDVEIVNEPDRARSIIRGWLETEFETPIASDLEWRSTSDEPVCAGFSARPEKAVVFGFTPFRDRAFTQALKQFYERSDIRFIWHNGKADTKILRKAGINGRVDEDTFLQSYALDERPGYHSLEYLLSSKFGWPDYEPSSVKEFKKTGVFSGKTEADRKRSERELYKYNGWDCAGTLQLFRLFGPRMETDRGGSVTPLYHRLLKASDRFRTVEEHGFYFDSEEACNINEREALPRLEELEHHIQEITGHSLLNPRSPTQLKAVIYGEFGLKHKLKDSGKKKLQTSTGKEVREEIEAGRFTSHPKHREQLVRWASAQRQFSKIEKLRGTYLEGLVIRAQADGKIYCRFNPCGTVSGRASSNDPNFQNIAREGYEEIPGIRTLFLPSPGNVIVSADFSQAELRTCAKLSGDPNLIAIYRDSSRSLHKERAAAFYGENYTKEEYVKCFHPDTEVLTKNGWIKVGDVTTETQVMQAIPKNDGFVDLEWAYPTEIHRGKSEKLIHLKNEGIDLRVTPNHRMVGWSNDLGKPKDYLPTELPKCRMWPNAGKLEGGITVDERLLRLALAIQADGSIRDNRSVTFGFKKTRKVNRLVELLTSLGIDFTLTQPDGVVYKFYIPDQHLLVESLRLLDDNKTLSWKMLGFSLESRKVIIDELKFWDATANQPRWKMFKYHSAIKKNVDVAQAIAASCGHKTRIARTPTTWDLSIKRFGTSRGGALYPIEVDYNGEVVCLTVPSSYLIVRDAGTVTISGNSKNINFGVTYGQSAEAFAQMYHMPKHEAQAYIDSWWNEFRDLKKWTGELKQKARKDGLIQSPFGHKRRFHLITEDNLGDVERESVNFLPQNIAAWLTISALCDLVDLGVTIVATVHDSLVADVPIAEANDVARLMRDVMQAQPEKQLDWTDMPFLADVSIGPNWGELEELEIQERIAA